MKITIEPTEMKIQASFRTRKGMGEFDIYFFSSPPENHSYSWGIGCPGEGQLGDFRLTLWNHNEEGGQDAVLTIKWEAENADEGKYLTGEVFSSDDKDSIKFLFVHYRSKEELNDGSFVYARANVDG